MKSDKNIQVNDVSLGVDETANEEEMFGLRTGNIVKPWNQR